MKNRVFNFTIIANTIIEPGMSGGNRIFIELSKRWIKKGAEVTVFTPNVGENLCRKNGLNDCSYITWSSTRFNRLGIFGLYLIGTIIGVVTAIKTTIKDNTIIYSSSDFWPDSLPGLIFKLRNNKCRWIACLYLVAHNPFSSTSPYKKREFLKGLIYWLSQKPIFWIIKRYADMVFVTNEPDRKKFMNNRLRTDNVIAIRGGVDVKLPLSVPESNEKIYDSVFIGRFHAQKGVIELIDIWKYVCNKKKKAKLGIIGIGDLEKRMRNKVEEYHLERNIDFLGFKDGTDKFKICKESKMALYPAILDHWSMAPVEAMSCGLPLVTFDISTLNYLNPKGMMRVPCYNLKMFAKSVIGLLDDKSLREKKSQEAVKWVKKWDWDKRANGIFNILKNLY